MSQDWPAPAPHGQSVSASLIFGSVTQIQAHGDVTIVNEQPLGYRVAPYSDTSTLAVARARAQPSRLLLPRYQAVPFTGRGDELSRVAEWMGTADPVSVHLIHAIGGQGKTRIATHLAHRAAAAGWAAWRAEVTDSRRARGSVETLTSRIDLTGQRGVLVVVDYTDRWELSTVLDLIDTLHRLNTKTRIVVRVLLLARTARSWWQPFTYRIERDHDIDAPTAQALPPLGDQVDRVELFRTAATHFAHHVGADPATAADLPVPDLSHSDFGSVLALHMAALVAVDTLMHGGAAPTSSHALSAYLLKREQEYWLRLHDLAESGYTTRPQVMGRAVYLATLTGALPRPAAHHALERTFLAHNDSQADRILDDHGYCYPPADPIVVLQSLEPDRLGEDLIALTTPGHPHESDWPSDDWASTCTTSLLHTGDQHPAWTTHMVTVLVETAHRWPHITDRILYPLLRARPSAAVEAGGAALVRLADLPGIDPTVLEAVDAALPPGRHIDLDAAAAAISTTLFQHRLAAGTAPADYARTCNNHAFRLLRAGFREDALPVFLEATTRFRELAATDPTAHLPDLARSLRNYATSLGETGHHEDAVPFSAEALAIDRKLIGINRAAHLLDLARSLDGHAVRLDRIGRPGDAVPLSTQGLALLRELVAMDRPAHLLDLAGSLCNHAIWLAETGHRVQALPISLEAVTLLRELAATNPTAHLPDLARSLHNHAIRLAETGHLDDAVLISEETVTVRRELTATNRAAHLPEFALTLHNHAIWLDEVGRQLDALPVLAEAVALRRELTEINRTAHLPDLTLSVYRQAKRLAAIGRHHDALPLGVEAVTLYRELAAANTIHLPDLAESLHSHARQLAATDRYHDALPVFAEAVVRYRELTETKHITHLSDLAHALHNHAVCLAETGHRDDAVLVCAEALTLRRELADTDRTTYLPDLAHSLRSHAKHLADTARPGDALLLFAEAVNCYRELTDTDHTHLPRLAESLHHHAIHLARTDHPDDAGPVFAESVNRYRELTDTDHTHLAGLADSLSNHAINLARTGHPDDAAPLFAEAVTLRRELTGTDRTAHLPELAQALHNHALGLAATGHSGDAVPISYEAVTVCRELTGADRTAHLPELVRALHHHALRLTDTGRVSDAVTVCRETITHLRELVLTDPATFLPYLAESLDTWATTVSATEAEWLESATEYEQCLQILPPGGGAELLVYRAIRHMHSNRPTDAAADITRAHALLATENDPEWRDRARTAIDKVCDAYPEIARNHPGARPDQLGDNDIRDELREQARYPKPIAWPLNSADPTGPLDPGTVSDH